MLKVALDPNQLTNCLCDMYIFYLVCFVVCRLYIESLFVLRVRYMFSAAAFSLCYLLVLLEFYAFGSVFTIRDAILTCARKPT